MLPAYKSILVPSDLSHNAINAFKHAVMLSRHNGAKIHLLHVVRQVDSSVRGYISTIMGDHKLEDLEEKHQLEAQAILKQELEEFAKTELKAFPDDLARFAGAEVLIGDPVVKILEQAKKVKADVIVIGSHSKGPVDVAFLGSITEKVLRKANLPVFVVPLTN